MPLRNPNEWIRPVAAIVGDDKTGNSGRIGLEGKSQKVVHQADVLLVIFRNSSGFFKIRQCGGKFSGAFDAHSLMVLGRAASRLDATPLILDFKAKVLYVLSRTDVLFPPSLAPGLMAQFAAAGVDASYFEIDSDHGHLAAGTDAAKWAPTLKAFMAKL